MNYDLDGRKINTIDALSRRTTLAMTTLPGRRSGSMPEETGQHIWDDANRLTNRQYPDGSRVSLVWDAASQRLAIADLKTLGLAPGNAEAAKMIREMRVGGGR